MEPRNQRERDASVAARRLEQLLSRLEAGRLDHRERDAVLDRAGRVLALELRVELDLRLRASRGSSTSGVLPTRSSRTRRGLSATRHGGQQDHRRAVVDLGLEPVLRAHVLALDVDVHERREAVVLEQLPAQ